MARSSYYFCRNHRRNVADAAAAVAFLDFDQFVVVIYLHRQKVDHGMMPPLLLRIMKMVGHSSHAQC